MRAVILPPGDFESSPPHQTSLQACAASSRGHAMIFRLMAICPPEVSSCGWATITVLNGPDLELTGTYTASGPYEFKLKPDLAAAQNYVQVDLRTKTGDTSLSFSLTKITASVVKDNRGGSGSPATLRWSVSWSPPAAYERVLARTNR
jgi:hypothetical protein